MKKIFIFIFTILLLFPTLVFALNKNYTDKIYDIVNVENEEEKVNLYLFFGQECPHCEKERMWLEEVKETYKDSLNIYEFEVWHYEDNQRLLLDAASRLDIEVRGVPFTVVGDSYFIGFSDLTKSQIENKLEEYINSNDSTEINIPILGKTNIKNVSIQLVAVILGFIDGFNPCAMWILLFLINLLFRINNKKKAWVLGLTFLFVSGLVYFVSMLGINFILSIKFISTLKILIAIFILIAGIYNLRKYFITRKQEAGCQVVDNKKRKKIITKMKKIIESKSFIISFIGIIALAISVNLIELACSLGFPVIFTEILALNNVEGFLKISYLLIYILFYMIDDILVFSISMFTLQATGITNKYNKLCTLVSSIIMILMGLLLIIKPEWLMLNF